MSRISEYFALHTHVSLDIMNSSTLCKFTKLKLFTNNSLKLIKLLCITVREINWKLIPEEVKRLVVIMHSTINYSGKKNTQKKSCSYTKFIYVKMVFFGYTIHQCHFSFETTRQTEKTKFAKTQNEEKETRSHSNKQKSIFLMPLKEHFFFHIIRQLFFLFQYQGFYFGKSFCLER